MSTSPFWMNGSRLAETDSFHSMLSSAMPSSDAMILPISTSKPSGSPDGPFRPNSGWSNFVPIVIEPASASVGHRRALRERGLRLGGRRRLCGGAAGSAAGARRQGEHAGGGQRDQGKCPALHVFVLCCLRPLVAACLSVPGRWGRPSRSVLEDLGQEVLRPLALRVGEELARASPLRRSRRRP